MPTLVTTIIQFRARQPDQVSSLFLFNFVGRCGGWSQQYTITIQKDTELSEDNSYISFANRLYCLFRSSGKSNCSFYHFPSLFNVILDGVPYPELQTIKYAKTRTVINIATWLVIFISSYSWHIANTTSLIIHPHVAYLPVSRLDTFRDQGCSSSCID